MAFTLGELAERVGGEVQGDLSCVIERVASLNDAGKGDIGFLSNPRYRKFLETTSASAVILARSQAEYSPINALVVDDPYLAYARVAALLNPPPAVEPGCHATAVISNKANIDPTASIGPHCVVEDGVVIGPRVMVGPGCVVGANSTIGEDCRLVANVTICHGVTIGRRVVIHPGAVIGGDGFGMANDKGKWVKIPQLGGVRIGDDVDIGANTAIDRGAIDDTIIEDGVKLDNLIQVGHNVVIGAHTAVAGKAGIAGSAKIGKYCAIGGAAGIHGHIEIADGVQISAMAMVTKSIKEPGIYSSGIPAEPNREWRKSVARFRKLEQTLEKIKILESVLQKKG